MDMNEFYGTTGNGEDGSAAGSWEPGQFRVPQNDEAPADEPVIVEAAPSEPVTEEVTAPPRTAAWSGYQPPKEPQPAPRKESPFANSPYVRTGAPTAASNPEPVRTQPRPAPRKRRSPMPLIALLTSFGVLVVMLCTSIAYDHKLDTMQGQLSAYADQVERLEDQLAAVRIPGSNGPSKPQEDAPTGSTQLPEVSTGVLTPAQVYAQCVDSVVAINCSGTAGNAFGQIMETASSGSGFILSEDGYIVTNYHVVEGSQRIQIALYDGTTYEAEYIGGNEANDIALIKVDAQDLPPVTIGSSTELIVGDQVAAIGNPLGELASTLTVGYVSAKDRIVTSDGAQINMLQTDAAINPGNSGGPLFNMYGEVVGITSAKYSGTTDSGASIEGIGFAIPTDDVMMMLEDLRNFGYITGGYLGVTVSEVAEDAIELYGLPQGVLVREVMPGSCAEKAGMRARDIIVELAGYEVKNLNSLSRALNKCKAGDEVTVIVYRGGSETELTVVLDERPQEEEPATEPTSNEQYAPWPGNGFFDDWFGGFFG